MLGNTESDLHSSMDRLKGKTVENVEKYVKLFTFQYG